MILREIAAVVILVGGTGFVTLIVFVLAEARGRRTTNLYGSN